MTINHPCPNCGYEISRDHLVRLYAPTKTKKEMAYLFGVTVTTICTWLKNLDIIHPRANLVDCPELDKMILQGMSNQEIRLAGIPLDKDLFRRRRRVLGMKTKKWERRVKES